MPTIIRFFIILCVLFLTGCATTREEVSSTWKGRTISEAIAELGPPQYTTVLPDGITVYTWEKEVPSTRSKGPRCITGLHVDKEGIIVDASQKSESLLC